MASFRPSYYPNYFSIQDILATQERVPCRFDVAVKRLGFLDPSSESEDISVGTSLELPYWLARPLSVQRPGMIKVVSVDMPRIYKEAYREILKADASVVDLHKLGNYFYEFGLYLSTIDHRDSAAIGATLLQTFRNRFRLVLDWAQNASNNPSDIQRLEFLERELYQEGREANGQLMAWLNEGASQISAAGMVVNHRKRKLCTLEEF